MAKKIKQYDEGYMEQILIKVNEIIMMDFYEHNIIYEILVRF